MESLSIVQNPKKFVFWCEELEYVGFWLDQDGVKLTEEMSQAISGFPRPADISGVWSWYGLVEHVELCLPQVNIDGAVP